LKNNAKVIALCGADHVGKSTQAKLLKTQLERNSIRTKIVHIPTDWSLTLLLHWLMLKTGLAVTFPRVFQLNAFLNKLAFQWFHLPYLRWRYDVIILDRWDLSSLVYGQASGLSAMFLAYTYLPLRRADLTIILDGEIRRVNDPDSYEADESFQRRVQEGYRKWFLACDHPNAIMISTNSSALQICREITCHLASKFSDLPLNIHIIEG